MTAATLEIWMATHAPWLSGWVLETAITAALVGLAFAAGQTIRILWGRAFLPIAERTRTELDLVLLTRTQTAAQRAIVSLILYAAARRLAELPGIGAGLAGRIVDGIFYALAIAAVARLIVAALDGLAEWYLAEVSHQTSTPLDEHFVPVVQKVAALITYFVAGTAVLDHVGVSVTALVTTAGVASLALALAAQETLSNMFAGFTLMLDRSYRVGDRIQLADGTVGDVADIGLRATKILSFDNELIIVPNRQMASARITNQSYPDVRAKVRVNVGVAYGTDLHRAKRILLEVCAANPRVLQDPAPSAYFTDFGESSLTLLAIAWVADYRDRFDVLDQLNMAVKERFEEEGIEVPFPQRDIHIRSASDVSKPRRPSPEPHPEGEVERMIAGRIVVGLTGEAKVRVSPELTAERMTSGAVEAYATPALLALMEHAAFLATQPLLPPGWTTVGAGVELRHLAATPVGAEVVARARLVEVEGRRLRFHVEALDGAERVGEALHERVIVDEHRFLERLAGKRQRLDIASQGR